MYIALAGNIGSGKTTLAEKLGKNYRWEVEYEVVDTNPYLPDFYSDMKAWAFHIQVYFLNSRFRQNQRIKKRKKSIIQDRTIYEDAHVFAKNLNDNGYLSDRDYETYLGLFGSMSEFIKPPDLLIYLKADIPKLVERINSRGRAYETLIRLEYLRDLNVLYENWINQYTESKVLTINTTQLNFDRDYEAFAYVLDLIESEIHGLFS
jgi:deoxyadenosine/deoxycytidine kinase